MIDKPSKALMVVIWMVEIMALIGMFCWTCLMIKEFKNEFSLRTAWNRIKTPFRWITSFRWIADLFSKKQAAPAQAPAQTEAVA